MHLLNKIYLLPGLHMLLTGLGMITGCACGQKSDDERLRPHYLEFSTSAELHAFFAYRQDAAPIISGHRGTIEGGMPENSIAGMEYVLAHTPAIFEIDPRLTKDSMIVVLHDATLDRTTNGTGNVADYTWQELKKLRLKDREGRITPYRISTLAEMIQWARGKTVLNLDKKDVPLAMTADIIRRYHADAFVMVTVHNAEDAKFFYDDNPQRMFSAFVTTPAALLAYERVGIPTSQMIAYIGPEIKASNQALYRVLHSKGIRCMISAAPKYDKMETVEERAKAYRQIREDGATVLESDLPTEVAEALQN
ncbi:glycerophosphoryl diester phosphodiesterase [Parapedobacter luteus]|uniref:Glycerophosphoryl diester phosphodiesterase n=1 Tax=Parapedobacter luteus TaxID=623280 RepID=A0A1T5A018_9SPHI|nr:glycerophosphodiester phosphodiesterase family protein [Parapedobacter luteus]SKB28310.1 glycerophosphoryl diester phosphodiesterase [Parapedobacter luteus]